MNCNIGNTLVVGFITSITGTIFIYFTNYEKKINIKKHLMIFFIVGMLVHILLEFFNFNSLCYDKKCYSNLCKGNIY